MALRSFFSQLRRFPFWLLCVPLFVAGFYSCPRRPDLTYMTIPSSGFEQLTYVKPVIGSGGFPWSRGSTSPAASAPFGRIRLGPDTTLFGKRMSPSGYGATDTHVLGFSHTRLSGTGAFEGGLLRVLPSDENLESRADFDRHETLLDKFTEESWPGYYSVYLPGPKVQVELGATPRTGLHRYHFFKSDEPRFLYFDLESHLYAKNDTAVSDIVLTTDLAQQKITVSGRLHDAFSGRYEGGLPFYFVVYVDTPWTGEKIFERSDYPGQSSLLRLSFGSANSTSIISLRVGLSHVDLAGAENNLSLENSSFDLGALLTSTWTSWQGLLGRVVVTGGSEAEKINFYTALYHSFLMPDLMDDPSGGNYIYPGFDQASHSATHPYYSDFSLWDTYRTLHPLYNLLLKDKHPDMLSSLLLMSDQGGVLPRWPSGAGNTGSMMGFSASIVMSEAAQKGLSGWDADSGFDWTKKMAVPGMPSGQECLQEFLSLGYCPSSVSRTLEYAYDFEAMSKWAALRNETTLQETWHAAALNFKKHWSTKRGLFVPRDVNGNLNETISESDSSYLNLTDTGSYYVEGTAWHWAFSPFILADELLALDPSRFHSRLEGFMKRGGKALGLAWPVEGYWHGNEHDYHAAWLFAVNGRPDLSQKWVRFILDNKYQPRAMGLDGEDDGGAMSSWYVWSAMGLFPVAGTDRFVLGTPIFDSVTVDMGSGNTLQIQTKGEPGAYLTQVSLNDVNLNGPFISESDLTSNPTLTFTRSENPSDWGQP